MRIKIYLRDINSLDTNFSEGANVADLLLLLQWIVANYFMEKSWLWLLKDSGSAAKAAFAAGLGGKAPLKNLP